MGSGVLIYAVEFRESPDGHPLNLEDMSESTFGIKL